jgi:hypothetical protein
MKEMKHRPPPDDPERLRLVRENDKREKLMLRALRTLGLLHSPFEDIGCYMVCDIDDRSVTIYETREHGIFMKTYIEIIRFHSFNHDDIGEPVGEA